MIDKIPEFLFSIGFKKLESGMIRFEGANLSVSYLNVEGNRFLEVSENVAGYVLYKIINVKNSRGTFNLTQMLSKTTFKFVDIEDTIMNEVTILNFLSKYGPHEFIKHERTRKFKKINDTI